MLGRQEQDFTIKGIKSAIHCINIVSKTPEKEYSLPYHYHDYIEVLYSLSSSANVWVNGEKLDFDTGDLIIINSREPHTVEPKGLSNYICIKFLPQILYSSDESLLEYKYVLPFISKKPLQIKFFEGELKDADIRSLILEIMKEWNGEKAGYELIIRANILKLFSAIFRYWQNKNILSEDIRITEPIKIAIDYISKNFAIANERDTARACGLSYNHFSYAFKNAIGQNFNDYLTSIKLKQAKNLLILTDKSITEIALETGFSSASHFISKFKAQNKITPKQFRSKTN